MQVVSMKTQLYYFSNQVHVLAIVSSHQADPKNKKERNNRVAILVRDLTPYKCSI